MYVKNRHVVSIPLNPVLRAISSFPTEHHLQSPIVPCPWFLWISQTISHPGLPRLQCPKCPSPQLGLTSASQPQVMPARRPGKLPKRQLSPFILLPQIQCSELSLVLHQNTTCSRPSPYPCILWILQTIPCWPLLPPASNTSKYFR